MEGIFFVLFNIVVRDLEIEEGVFDFYYVGVYNVVGGRKDSGFWSMRVEG